MLRIQGVSAAPLLLCTRDMDVFGATTAFLLFLKPRELVPASGPLHLLCLLPGIALPQALGMIISLTSIQVTAQMSSLQESLPSQK